MLKKINIKPRQYIIAGLIGIGTSLLVMTALLVAISILILEGTIGENMHFYMCASILTVSSFIGSMIACKVIREKIIVACLLNGALFWVMLAAINVILFNGEFSNIVPTTLLILGSCFGAGLVYLQINSKKRYSQKRTKYRRMCKVHK